MQVVYFIHASLTNLTYRDLSLRLFDEFAWQVPAVRTCKVRLQMAFVLFSTLAWYPTPVPLIPT